MKLYHFRQNNSGGSFDCDLILCQSVIIEAESAEEANAKAIQLGIYFDGVDEGGDCECCGDRWYRANDDDVITDPNAVRSIAWTSPVARVFYADGRVEEIN